MNNPAILNPKIFYFHGKSSLLPFLSGKKERDVSGVYYRCYTEKDETPYFHSHHFRKGHAADIFLNQPSKEPDLIFKLRKSFPLTGKIDLLDVKKSRPLGVATRGRKIFDRMDQLLIKFKDTKSWREHLGESVVDAVANAILGGGDAASSGGGITDFVAVSGKKTVGTLNKERLPFFPDPPKKSEPGKVRRFVKKVLPGSLGHALFDVTPPMGWKLTLYDSALLDDEMLLLCGTLMIIDIQRW